MIAEIRHHESNCSSGFEDPPGLGKKVIRDVWTQVLEEVRSIHDVDRSIAPGEATCDRQVEDILGPYRARQQSDLPEKPLRPRRPRKQGMLG